MPINERGEVWRRSKLISGIEYTPTKEFFPTQSDLDSRITEYKSSIWNPRHDLDGKSTSWTNANSAEMKALDAIRDKFHSTLTHHIVNKAHQSILPLKELVDLISKNCEKLMMGEEVKMEHGDNIILKCKVVKVHSEDSTYTINDGTREILRVPSAHLRRPHRLTEFDIESLIRLTCTQSEKDRSWQLDEVYKKEFGMKDKLAPIFCKTPNGSKKEAASSEDEVIVLPPVKKAKRESSDSLKENGDKKEVKEKKPRKRKEENGEKVARKKVKKEAKEEVITLESTDDETPLSVLADKLKEKKQKQGFLDKFLTASPSSSKGSPSKKKKGKVEKAIEPLVGLYKGEDVRVFLQECDVVMKTLTKELMDTRMETLKGLETETQSVEADIVEVLLWRKNSHTLNALVLKAAKEERAALRETNRKELDAMHGKIVVDKMKERIKTAKTMKEMEEEERGEDYDKSMGKLHPSGVVITSPHFPIALMISEFIFTRSNLFPPNYRLPMTEEIVEALSVEGKEKEMLAEKVTYPIVKILMDMLLSDEKYKTRFAFSNASLSKLKLDEYSLVEFIRVLVTGERPITKAERERLREEMMEEEEKKDDEERAPSPDGTEYDEEDGEGDITMTEEDRMELVTALEDCHGRWDRIEGRQQGMLIEFILNCFIDSTSFEIKTDVEVQEEHDDLKREKRELKTKIDDTKKEQKELTTRLEEKESFGLRLARSETSKVFELEETLAKSEKRMDEIIDLMKGLEREMDLAKYGNRLEPIGVDRHGRRYMLMPHYAGLLIQSIGSGEWIQDADGTEYFGFVPAEEEWRRVMSVQEWDELCDKLKNGSKSEKKMVKAMEKIKEKFESGLKWNEKVEENKKKGESENVDEEMNVKRLSDNEILEREMMSLLEKSENGELLKVKEISLLNRKIKEADSLEKWRALLLELEETLINRAKEGRILHRIFRMNDETHIFHSKIAWRKRVQVARMSELILLMRVIDYRIVWDQKEIYEKRKELEESKKMKEMKETEVGDEEWKERGVHTRRQVDSKDKKEVRDLMKRVIDLASGRLASTLNTLESDDDRLMNMKDIEDECHRYSIEKLKKVLRKNMDRWREEIESRFAHRLDQFDEFTEAVHNIL